MFKWISVLGNSFGTGHHQYGRIQSCNHKSACLLSPFSSYLLHGKCGFLLFKVENLPNLPSLLIQFFPFICICPQTESSSPCPHQKVFQSSLIYLIYISVLIAFGFSHTRTFLLNCFGSIWNILTLPHLTRSPLSVLLIPSLFQDLAHQWRIRSLNTAYSCKAPFHSSSQLDWWTSHTHTQLLRVWCPCVWSRPLGWAD